MQNSEFRKEVCTILMQDVEFLGDWSKIVEMLPDSLIGNIFEWLEKVVARKINAIVAKNLLVFRYPFTFQSNAYRVLLIKVKGSLFIEFHMGNHKYYDSIRKQLHLREDSIETYNIATQTIITTLSPQL